jgi:hypothetical protein
MTSVRFRPLSLALGVFLSAPLVLAEPTPARAGFWEDLFGIQEKPAAAPARPHPDQGLVAKRSKQARAHGEGARSRVDQAALAKALKASQSGKDPATLALQDNTLRRGDIVSGPNGLMVYMGGHPENPGEARFVPANDPNLARSLRDTLKSLKRPVVAAAPEASKPQPGERMMQAVSVERDGKVIRVIGTYQGGGQEQRLP